MRISIAPVKGLGLVHPAEVELGSYGVAGDRRFWLVDRDGRLVNGKTHGLLVRLRPDWDERARTLTLAFPDGERVEGQVELGEPLAPSLHGTPCPSRRVVGPWEGALSRFAGEPLTFLRADTTALDRSSRGGITSLVSRASIEKLREQAGRSKPVDGRRFRMTFEIDGVGANEEDAWLGGRVHVGEAALEPLGEVGRCVVTTHDPDSGVTDFDTLGVLARYRREGLTASLPLGIWASVVVPGRVRVGDPVRVGELAAT